MRKARYIAGAAALALAAGVIAPAGATEADTETPLATYYAENLEQYQWWMNSISAFDAHQAGFTGDGVVVAVLDTGVDGTHPDLAGQTVDGADTSNVEVVPIEAGTDSDNFGHGTHVAGIIAANMNDRGITGVAPGAKIMPVKVLTDDGSGSFEGIAAGIKWAAENGADVINMSLGGSVANIALTNKDELCQEIADAAAMGIPVIVAAGNEGAYGNPLSTPAGCPGSFSVSAINSDGGAAWFSSFDPSVRVAAPGQDVFSTFITSELASGYVPLSGTSMATPATAGVAALLKGQNPEASAEDVYDAMTSTATDLGRPGRDPIYGYGLVSATKALGVGTAEAAWLSPPHLINLYEAVTPKNFVVAWSVPGALEVASYRIESFPSGEVLATTGGDQVRAEFLPPGKQFSLSVVAELANGQTVASEPYYLDLEAGGGALETMITGKWSADGLLVKVSSFTGTYEAPEDLTLTLYEDSFQSEFQKPFYREVTLKKGTSAVFIPIDKTNTVRGASLMAMLDGLSFGPWNLVYTIDPQWPVAVNVIRVNKAQVTVAGALNTCLPARMYAQLEACVGRQVAVVDKNGRTLQRGSVATNVAMTPWAYAPVGYLLTVTKPPKKIRVIIGKWKSPMISVTSRYGPVKE